MNMNEDDFLEHFGVKGMKWGVRNKRDDGRTHYKTDPKNLTSDELQRRIKRMETEKRYKDLNARDISSGEKFAVQLFDRAGKQPLLTVAGAASLYAIKKGIEKKFGEDVNKAMFPKKK